MSFIITIAGRERYVGDIETALPDNVPTLEEVAHSLAQINRFCGHTFRPYSVAEHSLLVAQIALEQFDASPAVQLAALLHDAHECITGDASTPVKHRIGPAWDEFERHHAKALRRHYGLMSTFAAHGHVIRGCDLIALATERRDLLPFDAARNLPWPVLDTPGQVVEPFQEVYLRSASREHAHWTEWRDQFVAEVQQLQRAVAEKADRALRSPSSSLSAAEGAP